MRLTIDDMTTYGILLKVCIRYQVDIQYEAFFNNLLSKYTGESTHEALETWLDKEIPRLFAVAKVRPKWIQDPEWAFDTNQEPMIFLGQLDIDVNSQEIRNIFHDKTSIYLFVPRNGGNVTIVVQQF